MKKYSLGISVIVIFAVYAIHLRSGNANTAAAAVSKTTDPNLIAKVSSGSIKYKDGSYVGDVTDAFYGNVQVKVTISGGKITDVVFLQSPNDRNTSVEINSQAMPMLTQEAIQAQSAQVDGVSGATATSQAFIQSLDSALQQAV